MNDCIVLTQVPRSLADLVKADVPVPGYRKIYNKILDGVLPAEQINGRWYVRRSDLKAFANTLRSNRAA